MKLIAVAFAAVLLLLASYCSAAIQAGLYLLIFTGLWWMFLRRSAKPIAAPQRKK